MAGTPTRFACKAGGVKRIGVWHHHAERVVAAREIHHDKIPRRGALRQREIAQELRRSKAEREGRHAAADEVASGWLHTNWYSGDPTSKCSRPGALTANCASDPLHVPPARR